MKRITSATITGLLKERHKDDFYVEEISQGESKMDAGSGNKRLDGWAMKPSWSTPMYTGYEIKVSRADFIQDDKWVSYLPSCTHFYFVTPPGIVSKEEIPEQAGWIVTTKNGDRLLTKKKAPRLVVDRNRVFNIMKLILMRQAYSETPETADQWLQKIEADQWDKVKGREIARRITQKQKQLEREASRLSILEERLAPIEKWAHEIGIRTWHTPTKEEVAEKYAAACGDEMPKELALNLDSAIKSMERAKKDLEQFKKNAGIK